MPESVPILHLRSLPVLIDADLARLYGVQTRALNEATPTAYGRIPYSRKKGMHYPCGCPTPFEKLSGKTRNRQE
jgi:hypothetical protein